ncbi:MAG: maltose alpha-D-glucosyltransferase [Acidobacteriota bacterium]
MARRTRDQIALRDEPLWYKDAIVYETHVRAFFDSNADGIGDFPGLTQKLDYLQDLGVTAIWLLPFYPSPLRDDGYDIADYTSVNPTYGTLSDFKTLLREAHGRGLRIITELVLNHTSDQHPWFQRARRAKPGSAARDFYVWSDTPEKYRDARIIFKDFEVSNWSWDPVANAYYWHRFYSHQPDLNFESPRVRGQIFRALDFWLKLGVDGLRLDAIPYLYEREGTNCENLSETHAVLKALRRHIDRHFSGRMLLAEANQWPEDAAAYFGEGDECHMAFHFPLMPRMFMAVRMEDRFPIVDILSQTPAIPSSAQWALFLRNHDELTLEMVTDEERDYMYRVYAQDRQMRINVGIRRRLAPLLGNDRRKIELMMALLFSLPGTPVLYYGDEIGMGDNIYLGDRNGVRAPMQWSGDRNAGFSRASAQRLYLPIVTDPEYHYEAINVEVEQNNPSSPLWWTKRVIALRKRFQAFGRGSLTFLYPDNRKVLAYVRSYANETILVVANLSRFTQYVELDLSAFAGMVPVELFGRNEFPLIAGSSYPLTLGPHNVFWFALEKQRRPEVARPGSPEGRAVELTAAGSWETILRPGARAALEEALPDYLRRRRWFSGKARKIKLVKVIESIPIDGEDRPHWNLIRVEYVEGDPENYLLPLSFASGKKADTISRDAPQSVVAEIRGGSKGILFDGIYDPDFAKALLAGIERRRRWKGVRGEFVATRTPAFRRLHPAGGALKHTVLRAEQTNSSLIYADRFIAKLIRRPEEGTNPDLEVGRFLTEKAGFPPVPPVAGAVEFRRERSEPMTLAILQGYVANHGDAWHYALDSLGRYFERMLGKRQEMPSPPLPAESLLQLAAENPPPRVPELIGSFLQSAQLLGCRTAELHLALASRKDDPDFAPEPFSTLYQRSLYQSIRSLAGQNLHLLRKGLRQLDAALRPQAERVLEREGEISARLRAILASKIEALRIRIHGDYHLGQVLFTGKDFAIIDFEGEPARSLSARRLKRSALVDVAGMLRSFDYAASAVLHGHAEAMPIRPEDREALLPWAAFWTRWVSAVFLRSYLEKAGGAPLLPADRGKLAILLNTYLLEKALYEVGYELQNRPEWIRVALDGIERVLETARASSKGGDS